MGEKKLKENSIIARKLIPGKYTFFGQGKADFWLNFLSEKLQSDGLLWWR